MSSARILIVDDEAPVRKLIRACFEADGYEVDEAESMDAAYDAMATQKYDLMTFDSIMGSENGMQHLQSIKAKQEVAIIMVTGKPDVIDRVVAIELGADDYLAKPFHVRELLARAHAILRRKVVTEANVAQLQTSHLFSFEGWQLDTETRELSRENGEQVDITTADFKLLLVLLERPRCILSRDQLMDLIGGQSWTPLDRTIDNQVARLRQRIELAPHQPKLISTVRGVGYSFTADVRLG